MSEAKAIELFNAPLPKANSILDVIDRVAADPQADVTKLEKLLDMYERVVDREARGAYIAAMVKMKPLLPVIDRKGLIEVREKTASGKRDGDIQQSTSYAKWEDIDAAITPILHDHQFSLSFRSGVAQDGKITVTGILSHADGHSEETTITLPHDSSGSKNAVQAVGSSTSYGKRYTATLLLNIRTKGEDDDGVKGGEAGLIGDDKIETIKELITRTGADIEKFCKYMGVEAVRDITIKDYPRAITALNLKEKKVR